ncbi:MAG TPA: hypothetical protein VF335_01395 [Chitinivibrionales bacterium]
MNFLRIVSVGILTAAFLSSGEDLTIEKNLSGYASLEEGQIVQGSYSIASSALRLDHVWVQRMYTGLVGNMLFNPFNIEGNIGCEMRVSNEFPRVKASRGDQGVTRRLYFYPYLTEADFKYHIGDKANPVFSLTGGYFPIKYNTNSRNLGEYLFRSGAYPQTLVTDFDFAATRLFGLDVSASPIKGLSMSVILNSNVEWQAIGDLNLSGLVSYNFKDIFELGAGISQTSIVSADSKITDGDSANAGPEMKYIKSSNGPDTTIGLLSFRGTKVMAMASFDPLNLMKNTFGFSLDFFGKEDLKLYSEVAILGLESFPITLDSCTDYSDIGKRIPVMFGFNFPAFKLLDVLSIEGEWFGGIMPNNLAGVVFYDEPTPITSDNRLNYLVAKRNGGKKYNEDNWKWSVYAKRTLAGHFQIIGQVASDHMRWFAQDWTRQDWEEAFRNPRQFYYRFKLAYMF